MNFDLFSIQSAIICVAYFAAGVIDSVCGGGGLITVPTLMAMGLPIHCIAGTNQCSAFVGNFASIYKYARSGNINFKSGIITAITAIIGGVLGARLNMLIPEKYLQIIMIVLMPVMALLVFVKKEFGEKDRSDSLSSGELFGFSCLIGFVVGAYQGFYGPGAGTLYLLAFSLLIRMDLVKSSGTSRFSSMFAGASAAFTYAFSGLVIWKVVIVATAFNLFGNYLGASLAITKGSKIIRPFLLSVMALLFVSLIYKM